MKKSALVWGTLCLALGILGGTSWGANNFDLEAGNAELKSAGPLAFGPQGVLFVGDVKDASVVALATQDSRDGVNTSDVVVNDLASALAAAYDTSADNVQLQDLAVNPESGNVFLSLMLGGEEGTAAIAKLNREGNITPLPLDNIEFGKVKLPNAPPDAEVGEGRRAGNQRGESITDLAFVDGFIIVSGLSSSDAPANVRSIAFPFKDANSGASLEIFHGAHGRVEDYAPIRTFVPFVIDGKPNLLAGFTCTPLVRFPLDQLEPGVKVRGTTVAELGNRNRPLDMIVYKQGGKDYLLLSNSSRGVMKISTDDIEKNQGITDPVGGGGTAGQEYQTIDSLQGVVQLDRVNDTQAVVVVQNDSGTLDLKTIELP